MNLEAEIGWLKGQLLVQGEIISALVSGVVDTDELKAALKERLERSTAQLLGSPVSDEIRDQYENALNDVIRAIKPTSPHSLQARIERLEQLVAR
jgi:hypothetical protein